MSLQFPLLVILMLMGLCGLGQNKVGIGFTVNGLREHPVKLYSYYGDQRNQIDSAMSDASGHFSFHLRDDLEPGIYHVSLGREEGLDFIFSGEEMSIKIGRNLSPDSAVVKNSVENRILFEYLSKKLYYERRLELLAPVVYYYPSDDPFYDEVEEQFNGLEEGYAEYIQGIYDDHPDLIASRFIRFDQLEDVRPGEVSPQRMQYLRQHYFDGIDLTDTLLLYSPLLPGRIIDYLSLFVSPGVGKEQQEELFKQAIDSLMAFTLPGNKVREVVVNYLVEGFQAYGLEEVMSYLVENYVLDQSCVSGQREEVLKKRIEGFRRLAVGNQAPDIEARDISGTEVKLSALPWQYKVLFFWSSDCPHCSSAIPGLKGLREQYGDTLGIVAVSVDAEEEAWKKAVAEKGMDWINIAELKGWDGQIVSDYYIYATPTFLVLDKDLKILAKPTGIRDLETFLIETVDKK